MRRLETFNRLTCRSCEWHCETLLVIIMDTSNRIVDTDDALLEDALLEALEEKEEEWSGRKKKKKRSGLGDEDIIIKGERRCRRSWRGSEVLSDGGGQVHGGGSTGVVMDGTRNYLTQILPVECLERILCLLSPNALCAMSQTCRLCRGLASNPSLWKALYYMRWSGLVGNDVVDNEDERSWKGLYMLKDGEDVKNVGVCGEDTKQLYRDMVYAYREQGLHSVDAWGVLMDGGVSEDAPGSVSEHVARFKKRHGILGASASSNGVGNTRNNASTSYARNTGSMSEHVICEYEAVVGVADHWMCRCCGNLHVCGGGVCEFLEPCHGDDGMMVCRLTGAVDRRDADADLDVDHTTGVHEEPGDFQGSRLGRAFEVGYHAEKKDLFMVYGVTID